MKVSKRGGRWRAEATDADRHFASTGEYPPGALARQKTSPPQPFPGRRSRSSPGRDGAPPGRPDAQDLHDHGGALTVVNPSYFAILVSSANRYGKVPDG